MNSKDLLLQLVQSVFPEATLSPDERNPVDDAIYVDRGHKEYAVDIKRALCMFDEQWVFLEAENICQKLCTAMMKDSMPDVTISKFVD